MIDEWCGSAPGRFIPLTIIPLWDPQLAVVEMERVAARLTDRFLVQGDEVEDVYCNQLRVHPSRIVRFLPAIGGPYRYGPVHR